MLPGFWPHAATTYLAWFGIGTGFIFVEVAAKTLMHRLGSDETMGRVISALESGRLAAMAAGSIGAIFLVEALHPRGALIALGALMPLFVLVCWVRLRAFEVGAPVNEDRYQLLRANSIFEPLPIATVERLSHDLSPVTAGAGEEVIVQGERGDRFYLIESGQVEVFENGDFRRNEGPGESFGEIALLHDVPSHRDRPRHRRDPAPGPRPRPVPQRRHRPPAQPPAGRHGGRRPLGEPGNGPALLGVGRCARPSP